MYYPISVRRLVGRLAALSLLLPAGLALAGNANVDARRLIAADKEPGNWMSHGRTYGEQRFSPLAQVNARNVDGLGLAWTYRLDVDRGVEATPIVVDGVMYTTGAKSIVYALDAANGKLLGISFEDHSEGRNAQEIDRAFNEFHFSDKSKAVFSASLKH